MNRETNRETNRKTNRETVDKWIEKPIEKWIEKWIETNGFPKMSKCKNHLWHIQPHRGQIGQDPFLQRASWRETWQCQPRLPWLRPAPAHGNPEVLHQVKYRLQSQSEVSPFGEVAQCKGRSLKRGRDPDPVSEAWRSSIEIEGGQKHIRKPVFFPFIICLLFVRNWDDSGLWTERYSVVVYWVDLGLLPGASERSFHLKDNKT